MTDSFPAWKENINELWLAEHSCDFAYLRYYEALSITRAALICKDHASCFAIDGYAKHTSRDLLG